MDASKLASISPIILGAHGNIILIGCKTVEIDIENFRPYSAKTYAAEVNEYIKHIPSDIQVIIYTGEGFLPYLSPWPMSKPYSWAQYPYALRPNDTLKLSWEQLREKLFWYIRPNNSSRCPGKLLMWQFTGDKLVLPGSDKGLDVYAWLGTDEELDEFFASDYVPPVIPPVEEKYPALPGPYTILSHREAGEGWFWPDGKLSAYPAVVPLRIPGGRGNLALSTKWLSALKNIMSALQWKRTWTKDEGWSNNGEIGRIQNVYFSHNPVWANKKDSAGYAIDTYYDSDTPTLGVMDKYRRGIMTVDYKTGHDATGGVINSDLLLPVIVIVKDKSEVPHIEERYMKPLAHLPLDCKVKTNGDRLNVRDAPSTGAVITTLVNNTSVKVFELRKVGNNVWLRITQTGSVEGWIAGWLTDVNL